MIIDATKSTPKNGKDRANDSTVETEADRKLEFTPKGKQKFSQAASSPEKQKSEKTQKSFYRPSDE